MRFFFFKKAIQWHLLANLLLSCEYAGTASFNHIWSSPRFSFLVLANEVPANALIFFDCVVVHLSCSFSCRRERRRKETVGSSEGKCKNSDVNYQYFILNISEVLQCRHKLIRWMASSLPSPSPPLSDSLSLLHFVLSLGEKGAHLLSPCAPRGSRRPPLSHPLQAMSPSGRHGELVLPPPPTPSHGSGSWATLMLTRSEKKKPKM